MATPPFPVEDQTDEDFFDKLVDDDGSSFEPPIKSLSNLSLDEMTAAFGDAGDIKIDSARNNSEDFSQIDNTVEKDILVAEESISLVSSNSVVFDAVVESSDSAEKDFALDSVTGKSESFGSTSVKEIQWSSFNADGADCDAGGFGSYSDFFHELGGDSGDQFGNRSNDFTKMASQWNSAPIVVKNQVSDARSDENPEGTISGRANREENQGYSMNSDQTIDEQAVNGSSQYWENLYPGWRVDPKTGEWYQLDCYDASGSNEQENCQEQEQFFSNGNDIFAGQNSEISYLQQTSQSVVGTVAEGCTTGSVSNWTQPAHGNTDYPPNFVFDAQYPGWYYDTITQQWDLLETYHQTVQAGGASAAAVSKHVQMQPETGFPSGGFADKDFSFQSQGQGGDWAGSTSGYAHGTDQAQVSFSQQNMWYSGGTANSGAVGSYLGDHQTSGQFISGVNLYDRSGNVKNYADQQTGFKESDTVSLYGQTNPGYDNSKSGMGSQSFAPADNSYLFNPAQAQQNQQTDYSHDYYGSQKSIDYSLQPYQTATSSSTQFLYGLPGGRTSAGRPPHALVTFGFGGKLIVMKDSSSFSSYSTHGSQDSIGGSISIHNLVDVVTGKTNAASIGTGTCEYVLALCRQSFPGPLVGANVASKELNKWIDERIANCESSNLDFRKAELLRLLLSLLKICCQNYGKLRSPFGADAASQESDGPESAVTKLFASAKKNGAQLSEYGAFTPCLQSFPSEGQIRATSVEVQNLLVSGRRKEALECAQKGQLWGPALVLAAQLGEKFYVDTVKQMAHRQFVSGSPLRTLCLLIAGQPADVFSTDTSISSSLSGGGYVSQQPAQVRVNGMIDDWEENLAIITANRTKDDELVIVHLGDCLWKEKDEVTAAHTCYLVAEANFESFSDTARLCLIGADHWKCPRTYASPEAIQRTELYEYAKVLGNSQFILPPFQPYKIIYAHMLAEVGKISESLKYCQAISKSLKHAGRTHEVELWKSMLSSLEERIRTHQQGGYGTNLAPSKLVGKIIPFLDTTIHRIIGAPPPPLPPLPPSSTQHIEHDTHSVMPKIANSSLEMTSAPLMPSASMEPISEWTGDNSRMTMPNRSISEPDFGRNPVQKVSSLKDGGPTEARSKVTAGGPSRFGRFGSQILQKTMGWVSRSRPDRQAKLGDTNKFYYDEKLKRWVEEGAEPPAEEIALPPPPPTTATFQNGALDHNMNGGLRNTTLPANAPETKSPVPIEQNSGIPPIPTSTNQFSARGHMGVRSRYVDTFNKSSGTPKTLFQSPPVPVAKPVSGAKFFIPTPTVSGDQTLLTGEVASSEDPSLQATTSSPSPLSSASSLSSSSINRFPSMDNIAPIGNKGMGFTRNGNEPLSSRSRAASWSGSFSERKMTGTKSQSETFGIPSMALPPPVNGSGSFGDELHEVEL